MDETPVSNKMKETPKFKYMGKTLKSRYLQDQETVPLPTVDPTNITLNTNSASSNQESTPSNQESQNLNVPLSTPSASMSNPSADRQDVFSGLLGNDDFRLMGPLSEDILHLEPFTPPNPNGQGYQQQGYQQQQQGYQQPPPYQQQDYTFDAGSSETYEASTLSASCLENSDLVCLVNGKRFPIAEVFHLLDTSKLKQNDCPCQLDDHIPVFHSSVQNVHSRHGH